MITGESDAVATLFPPQTPVIGELARDARLQIVRVPNASALSSQIGYVQPTTIPAGSFSLSPPIPSADVLTVGIPVTVIAQADLPATTVHLIAERLTQTFSGATSTSAAGEFPSFIDAQLPVSPAAREFYESGRPWQYSILPGPLAEVFYLPLLLGSTSLILMSIYKFLLPDIHGTWSKILPPRQAEALLTEVESARREGRPLTNRQRRRLTRLLAQRDRERSISRRLDAYGRGLLEDPPADERPT